MYKSTSLFISLLASASIFSMNSWASDNHVVRTQKSTYKKSPVQRLDFNSPYPEEWNNLSIPNYFSLLQNQSNPQPQEVINWYKGIHAILTDTESKFDRKPLTLARVLTLLSQKAKTTRYQGCFTCLF